MSGGFLHRIRYIYSLQTVRTLKSHPSSSKLALSKKVNAKHEQKATDTDDLDYMVSDLSSWRSGHQKWTKSPYRIKQLRFSRHIMNLVHKGKMADAVEVFETMRKKGIKPEAVIYNSLIGGFRRQGNIRESFRTFNQVVYIWVCKHYTVCMSEGYRNAQA